MANPNGISWSPEKNNSKKQSVREQVADAYLARLIYQYAQLSPREVQLLKRFFSAVVSLGPVLDKNQKLSPDLRMLIELMSNLEAERSNVKVEDVYSVSYGEHVKGIGNIKISRNEIRERARLWEKSVNTQQN
jgi:hypothetical protein